MRFIGKLALILIAITYGTTAFAIPRLDIDVDTSLAGIQSSRVVLPGTVFDVEILISGVTGLYAYDIDVDHDPSVLDATDAAEGSFLSNLGVTFFAADHSGNPVNALATLLTVPTGATGSGVLFSIQYTALALGTSSLQFTYTDLVDDQFEPIAVDLGGARIIVSEAPLPSTLLMLSLGLAAIAGLRRR